MLTKNAGRPSEQRKTKVIHIYKDFDVFNGLISEFFVIAKYINRNLFDTTVCVFNYEGGNYGKKFQELGGKLHNLGFGYGVKGILNTVFQLSAFLREQKPDIGVGVLVPIRDEKAVAASIISLLKNPQKMAEVGKRGHDRAFEIFTPMRFIEQLERLYIRLLSEKGIANVAN